MVDGGLCEVASEARNKDSARFRGLFHYFIDRNLWNLRKYSSYLFLGGPRLQCETAKCEDPWIVSLFFLARASGIFVNNPPPKTLRSSLAQWRFRGDGARRRRLAAKAKEGGSTEG